MIYNQKVRSESTLAYVRVYNTQRHHKQQEKFINTENTNEQICMLKPTAVATTTTFIKLTDIEPFYKYTYKWDTRDTRHPTSQIKCIEITLYRIFF